MEKRFLIVLVFIAALYGCSTAPGFFNSEHPGRASWAGGEVQLLFSNPEYDSDSKDKLERDYSYQKEVFGSRGGSPMITGGIGAMGVWRF